MLSNILILILDTYRNNTNTQNENLDEPPPKSCSFTDKHYDILLVCKF